MRLTVKTFDGHDINDGANYRATGLNFGVPASATPIFVEQAGGDALYAETFTVQARNLALEVSIADYGSRNELADQLREWFLRGTTGELVVRFGDEAIDYQLRCTVQSAALEEYSSVDWLIILQSGETTWRAVDAEEESAWVPAASGETKSIDVSGQSEARLAVTITPTAAPASGYQYQRLYQLVNSDDVAFGLYPWCIELDTDALVTAGKMQADCDDLRIVIDGQEVKRWIADPNTTTTKVWFNLDLSIGYSLDLQTAVASSGDVGELVFKATSRSKYALKKMPASGIVFHGTEWFLYSGKDVTNRKLGVVARGALGTTMQAHSAADVFQYIQHVIYIVYGNSAATDPADDDEFYDSEMPVFDLGDSDNENWVYTSSSEFYDPDYPDRPGSWKPVFKTFGGESEWYQVTQDGATGDPAMGMKLACWEKAGRWQSETGYVYWYLRSPVPIDEISTTGSKYRSTSRWPSACLLQQYHNAKKRWGSMFTETTPVNEDTWTAVSHSSVDASYNPTLVRYILSGSLTAATDGAAYFEVLTCTVVFLSAYLPSGSLASESGNYPMAITLTNETTGDALTVVVPMKTNTELVLDGENFTATLDDANCHGAVTLDDNSRETWIRLNPGTNSIKVESASLGTVSVDLWWYPRRQ